MSLALSLLSLLEIAWKLSRDESSWYQCTVLPGIVVAVAVAVAAVVVAVVLVFASWQ